MIFGFQKSIDKEIERAQRVDSRQRRVRIAHKQWGVFYLIPIPTLFASDESLWILPGEGSRERRSRTYEQLKLLAKSPHIYSVEML